MKRLIPLFVVVSILISGGYALASTPRLVVAPALQVDTPTPDQTITSMPTTMLELLASITAESQLLEDRNSDGKVDPGDTIHHTITFSKTAETTITNAILRSICDPHLIASTSNITNNGRIEDDDAISWELRGLSTQTEYSVSYDATLIDVFPPGTTNLQCRAILNAAELVDPIVYESTLDLPSPRLTVKKESMIIDLNNNSVLNGGESIRYTITYENKGSAAATNVIIRDDYPEELFATLDNITSEGINDGDFITWEITKIAAGDSKTLQYEATLKDKLPLGTSSIENLVEIASDWTDPTSYTHSLPISLPKLTISKEEALVSDINENGSPDPGEAIRYTIKYANIGTDYATEVVIIDDYPETLFASVESISPWRSADGIEIAGKDDRSMITWTIGTLASETSGEVSYQATLGSKFSVGSTNIVNKVTITSKEVGSETATTMLRVDVAPTPTPNPTPTPSESNDVTGGIYGDDPEIPSILLGLLAAGVLGTLIYIGTHDPIPLSKDAPEDIKLAEKRIDLAEQRLNMVREGVFIVFIISAILILAIGQGIKQDGAISILSAIVGYIFGRAVTRVTK